MNGHLQPNGRSGTIVDGLLSRSGPSWLKVDGQRIKRVNVGAPVYFQSFELHGRPISQTVQFEFLVSPWVFLVRPVCYMTVQFQSFRPFNFTPTFNLDLTSKITESLLSWKDWMLCNQFLDQILNFQCEHSFSKPMAHQLKNNNKQSAVIFILIQLLMFRQQSQMTVLAILRMNALVSNRCI